MNSLSKNTHKAGIQLHLLKKLIEQSSSTKDRSEVKAILLPTPERKNILYSRQHSELVATVILSGRKKANIRNYNQSLYSASLSLRSSKNNFELIVKHNLYKEYKAIGIESSIENVQKIIYNDNAHIVALFKEYLIYDDAKELFHSYYSTKQSIGWLGKCRGKEKLVSKSYMYAKNPTLRRAAQKKCKVQRIKQEDAKERGSESTFLYTEYMNSLALEDLSNSRTSLPADSLNTAQNSVPLLQLLQLIDRDSNFAADNATRASKSPGGQSAGRELRRETERKNEKAKSSKDCYMVAAHLLRKSPSEVACKPEFDIEGGKITLKQSNNSVKKYMHKNLTLIKLLSSFKASKKHHVLGKSLSPKPESKNNLVRKNYFAIYNKQTANNKPPINHSDGTTQSVPSSLRLTHKPKKGHKALSNGKLNLKDQAGEGTRLVSSRKGKVKSEKFVSRQFKNAEISKEKLLKVRKCFSQRGKVYNYKNNLHELAL